MLIERIFLCPTPTSYVYSRLTDRLYKLAFLPLDPLTMSQASLALWVDSLSLSLSLLHA